MAQPERREIDWSTAEILQGNLTVELTGETSKDWKKRFSGVLGLLEPASREWGEIALTKQGIGVERVGEGSEGDLRHLLESAVLEVNSQLGLDTGDREQAENNPGRETDERITATFQSFAAAEDSRDQPPRRS